MKEIAKVPLKDLVFLDESGANLQMAPCYGRGYKKSRVCYAVPFNRGNRLTLISAISITDGESPQYKLSETLTRTKQTLVGSSFGNQRHTDPHVEDEEKKPNDGKNYEMMGPNK